ncbi:MAG: nucleotidyltransferase domain-containing protein [Gemmatimonadales bacterium]
MGITKKALKPVASALFSSVQSDLLGLLYGQPDREFMGAELIRQIGRGTGAVHRQLQQFASSGLVTVTKRANQTYYRANTRNPIFPELRGIVLKTTGLAEPLRQALAPFAKEIVAAFVFGSIAAGRARPTSDVDLMILTDDVDGFSYSELFEALGPVERTLARPVNPIIMSVQEWGQKRMTEESFVDQVANSDRIMILGDTHAIA